jgi:Protein of unknown function (DUF2849)
MTAPQQQKLKITGPVVVTANRLADGAVVYLTVRKEWTIRIEEAAVVSTAPAATELLQAAIADDVGAVGPYIAPVDLKSGAVKPGNLRESIRLQGPTFELPASFGI